jgi:hypothetical protein
MVANDRNEISLALRNFKTEKGAVNFPAVLSIPNEFRLPEMIKKDFKQVMAITTVALTTCFEGMNLKRPMNANQILDLGEAILDSCSEDYLALEDIMLFLQRFVRGEYGAMYESMDIPKFMLAFESYREERHKALMVIKENRHLELKALGGGNRSMVNDPLEQHFANLTGQLSSMRAELREVKRENKKED